MSQSNPDLPPNPDLPLIDSFLYSRLNFEKQVPGSYGERHYRLRPLQQLLELLGNPQHSMAIVHVAGTKGKGSVCSMVHHILQASGYRSGLYTSPHIHHLHERFVIDGRIASCEMLAETIRVLQPAVEEIDQQSTLDPEFGILTFFDLCTAAAFVFFYQQAVQIAVIEVGMGGRLDSTNVVRPLVSIITNVSLDHTQQLGNTVVEIAREKAGIIKQGVPVISGVVQEDAKRVVQGLARENQSPLAELGKHVMWQAANPVTGPCQVRFQDPHTGSITESLPLQTPLIGIHQRDNVALAYAASVYLRGAGWELPSAAVQTGIANAQPVGRLQIVKRSPLVVLDVAHNPASFAALVRTLMDLDGGQQTLLPGRKTLVFAVSREKDYREMLRIAAGYFDRIFLTRFHRNPRSTELERLRQTLAEVTDPLRPPHVELIDDPEAAFQRACSDASPSDCVVVAGSLFLLAEIGSWSPQQSDVE